MKGFALQHIDSGALKLKRHKVYGSVTPVYTAYPTYSEALQALDRDSLGSKVKIVEVNIDITPAIMPLSMYLESIKDEKRIILIKQDLSLPKSPYVLNTMNFMCINNSINRDMIITLYIDIKTCFLSQGSFVVYEDIAQSAYDGMERHADVVLEQQPNDTYKCTKNRITGVRNVYYK